MALHVGKVTLDEIHERLHYRVRESASSEFHDEILGTNVARAAPHSLNGGVDDHCTGIDRLDGVCQSV